MFTFDTLEATRKLRDAGFEEHQAEAVVRVLSDSQESWVTREHLKSQLELFEHRIVIKIGGLVIAAVGILIAYMRLPL